MIEYNENTEGQGRVLTVRLDGYIVGWIKESLDGYYYEKNRAIVEKRTKRLNPSSGILRGCGEKP